MISVRRLSIRHAVMAGAIASAALTVGACESATATRPIAAYDPTLLTGGVSYRWTTGSIVRVYVVDGDAAINTDLAAAVRHAMVVWNAARQFNEFTLQATTNIQDAQIVVLDRTSPLPVIPGSCTFDPRSSSGYTYFCPDTGVPRRAERLRFVSGLPGVATVVIRVDRGRTNASATLKAVMAHEFGHALGLGAHSDVATDLMFGLPSVEAPSSRDIGTLRHLLGRPADLIL